MTLTFEPFGPIPRFREGASSTSTNGPGRARPARRARTFVARPASDFISFEPMTAGIDRSATSARFGSKGPAEADRILLAGHRWRAI